MIPGAEATYWNGERCEARIVRVIVADDPDVPLYWARPYVGQEREVVEVSYGGRTFYIDNEGHENSPETVEFLRSRGVTARPSLPGEGWSKVTEGRGSPHHPHSSLRIERVVE